jgi:hypothetical protein
MQVPAHLLRSSSAFPLAGRVGRERPAVLAAALLANAVITLGGCAAPLPDAQSRLPAAQKVCERVPLGVPLEAAAAVALEKDGTVLMGGGGGEALFALSSPKNCGCRVELGNSGETRSSEARCA